MRASQLIGPLAVLSIVGCAGVLPVAAAAPAAEESRVPDRYEQQMREKDGPSEDEPGDGMGMMPPSHKPHMEKMRNKHADMERRMAMMEQMMQMMLDREPARP